MLSRCLKALFCAVLLEMAQAGGDHCDADSEPNCESFDRDGPKHSDLYSRESQVEHNNQNMQLVLFDESKLFPHQTKEKVFDFAGVELKISQDWDNVGVAGVVWDAAVTLSEYIQDNSGIVKDRNTIELGAGTGLVGMVAGLLGASHVDITDRAMALEQLKENVNGNIKGKCDSRVTVAELDWGIGLDKYATYDVILGADIVYIEETFSELRQTLLHLSDCDTIVLLSCRIRYDRDKRFISSLKDLFTVELVHRDNRRNNVIYRCTKIC